MSQLSVEASSSTESIPYILRGLKAQRDDVKMRLSALDSAIALLSPESDQIDKDYHPDDDVFTTVTDDSENSRRDFRHLKLPEAILQYFSSAKHETPTCAEIRAVLKAGGQKSATLKHGWYTVNNALRSLRDRKVVEKVGRGRWTLTARGS